MAKSKVFSKEQQEILRRKGIRWQLWEPVQDLPNSMIIRQKITGEFKVIEKR